MARKLYVVHWMISGATSFEAHSKEEAQALWAEHIEGLTTAEVLAQADTLDGPDVDYVSKA